MSENRTLNQLTLFAEASHVNPTLLPGSAEATEMTVRSGRKCSELFLKSNLLGSFAKMLLESSAWHSTKCFLTWKVKATPAGRLLFRLVPSMPRTEETEYGSLPALLKTPTASEGEGGVMEIREGTNAHYKLRDQIAAFLPTPKAQNANAPGIHGNGGQDLQTAITLLPTMTVSGKYNRKGLTPKSGDGLATAIGKNTGMMLQPEFAEWMMGFPEGWTDIKEKD